MALLLLVFTNKLRLPILSLVVLSLFIHVYSVLPFLGVLNNEAVNKESSNTISVFYANINSYNSKKELLINYITDTSPDVVMLVEFNSVWAEELLRFKNLYPHTKAIVKDGNFGMAVLSKFPLLEEKVYVDKENMIPAISLKGHTVHGVINLGLLHAFPPIGAYGTMIRDQYLYTLSNNLKETIGPMLVCGDFNTTPWASIYKKIINQSDLNYIRNQKIPNTWPSSIGIPLLPIDHCLFRDLSVVKYERGPYIGSDHFPLIVHLVLPNRSASSIEE